MRFRWCPQPGPRPGRNRRRPIVRIRAAPAKLMRIFVRQCRRRARPKATRPPVPYNAGRQHLRVRRIVNHREPDSSFVGRPAGPRLRPPPQPSRPPRGGGMSGGRSISPAFLWCGSFRIGALAKRNNCRAPIRTARPLLPVFRPKAFRAHFTPTQLIPHLFYTEKRQLFFPRFLSPRSDGRMRSAPRPPVEGQLSAAVLPSVAECHPGNGVSSG